MTRLLDGPAAREVLWLRRTPPFLRAVFNPRKKADQWDALDQLEDEPKPHEQVHVYVRVEVRGYTFVKCQPRSAGGPYPNATYRLHDRQPDDATARGTAAWRAWCYAERDRLRGPRIFTPEQE